MRGLGAGVLLERVRDVRKVSPRAKAAVSGRHGRVLT